MEDTKNYWKIFEEKDSYSKSCFRKDYLFSYLNTRNWISHLENMGWKCYRWKYALNEKEISYVISFVKFYPFKTGLVWIPGGVIGSNLYIGTLNRVICDKLALKNCYIRIRSQNESNTPELINFLVNGWKRPLFSLGSNMSMILNIENDLDTIFSKFSRNWKRAIRKSKNNIFYKETYKVEEIASIYEQMYRCKSLKKHEVYSSKTIRSILNEFKQDIIIYGAFNASRKLIAIRGAIINSNNIAFDIFAACGEEGRKLSVTNGLLFRLIEECKSRNCKFYDLNGIDPFNSKGVYLFKKGSGAKPINIIGEFESSSNNLLALGVNLFLLLKRSVSI